MADVSQLLITVDSDGVRTATGDLDLLTKTGKKTQKTTETLDQAAKKLTKQFEKQGKTVGMTAGQIKILELKEKGATKAQLDAATAALKNAEALKKQADAARFASQSAGETNGAFRAMRGSTQQLSWQLQDVAVQAQMGTSAFTILGQQGPQIASIFGSGGAVLGALVAFGAILAGAVYRSLTGTGEAMKKLKTINESLIESFDDLTDAQKAYARSLALKEIKQNEQAIADLEAAQERSTKQVLRGNFAYKEFSESLDNYNKRLLKNQADVDSLEALNRDLATSVDDMTDSTDSLLKTLGEELATLNLTEAQLFAYQLAMSGATKEQIALGVATFNKLQKDKKAIEALEDAEAAVKKQTEASQNYTISLNNQLVLLNLSGDALFLYQASLKGGTMAEIEANAALLKSIALRKEKIKADADFAKNELALAALFKKLNDKKIADEEKAAESAVALAQKAAQRGLEKLEKVKAEHKAERDELQAHLDKNADFQDEFDAAMIGQARETALILAEIEAKKLEDNKTYLQKWFEQNKETLMSIDAMSVSVAEGMESGFAESFGSFLKGTATAEEAMKGLVVSVGQNMAQMVADMIAQYMAYHLMQRIMGKSTQASEATAMSLNATALSQMAGLAAFASTAAIPIVGPAAAPAAMVAAIAITAPVAAGVGALSGMAVGARALGGQVRGGESYLVGERGPELLTMGTSGRVTSNDSLKNAMGDDNSSSSNVVNVNFSVQANDTAGFDRLLQSRRGQIVGMINDAVNNRGRASIV